MLAFAPPMQHSTLATTVTAVDLPHRPQSSTPGTSSRPPTRPSQRKLHSSIIIPHPPPSSSSYINVTAGSASRSAPLEAQPAHRPTPQRTPPTHPIPAVVRQRQEDDDPHTPPASDSEDNEPVQPDVSGADVHTYEPETLLRMLATALKRIADLNASIPAETYMPHPGHSHQVDHSNGHHPPIWRTLTSASRHSLSTTSSLAFHARNVPTIALEGYLNRIHKYCPASNEVFISLLVYLDRMSKLAKEACEKTFPIDMYNIHRLIIAGVTVASKFFSDVFYTNSRYAKVGGLPLAELNQLELQFLLLNDFSLPISCEEMEYYTTMVDLQSKIPEGVDLTPYLPSPSSDTRQPVSPTEFFAAVDAYLGQHHYIRPSIPPRQFDDDELSLYNLSSRRSTLSMSDAASEAGTETDFDGSTDDEPTIRPPHSSSSSETMSLHSANGDGDSIFTQDSDMSREENGDVSMQRPPDGTPGRDYMMVRTPS
ncbi:cyclin-domain-containing protein [Rhodofomes roseus]|uniref:Cyclin-domain-containing protein n=1 Tax=Rhodofomes roseus TaxID=34475 RepID=A0ABQ8KWS3_9APHY|nr:cyclin-domain-containing protein [Rhodofomes roseus]KAH9843749.1 cyclin-domain-containing protein [Rhodofomes roseus]